MAQTSSCQGNQNFTSKGIPPWVRVAHRGYDVGEAKLFQKRTDVSLAIVNAEALLYDPLKIDPPQANDAILRAVGSCLDIAVSSASLSALDRGSTPPAWTSHKPSGP